MGNGVEAAETVGRETKLGGKLNNKLFNDNYMRANRQNNNKSN